MIVPPVAFRREVDRSLAAFFRSHKNSSFRRAVAQLCRYYGVRSPRIEWYEYLDWGKSAGKTYEDGRIYLIHPENWKRGRIYKSERLWIQTLYHEMAHYLFWTDAERKADAYARRMVSGLRRVARRVARAAAKRKGRRLGRAKSGAMISRRRRRLKRA
jgi:hypothetical protein